jgi:hypothetical protein
MKLEYCQQFFEKYSSTKFRENPTSGWRDVSCGQTERDVTKLILALRGFANAPKNVFLLDAQIRGK